MDIGTQSKALFVERGDGSGEVSSSDKWQVAPMYLKIAVNLPIQVRHLARKLDCTYSEDIHAIYPHWQLSALSTNENEQSTTFIFWDNKGTKEKKNKS